MLLFEVFLYLAMAWKYCRTSPVAMFSPVWSQSISLTYWYSWPYRKGPKCINSAVWDGRGSSVMESCKKNGLLLTTMASDPILFGNEEEKHGIQTSVK